MEATRTQIIYLVKKTEAECNEGTTEVMAVADTFEGAKKEMEELIYQRNMNSWNHRQYAEMNSKWARKNAKDTVQSELYPESDSDEKEDIIDKGGWWIEGIAMRVDLE
jgi:hypothetical protein